MNKLPPEYHLYIYDSDFINNTMKYMGSGIIDDQILISFLSESYKYWNLIVYYSLLINSKRSFS